MSHSLKVVVIGAGYVGLVTAAMLVEIGHLVTVLDTAPKPITMLRQGQTPIAEPEFHTILNAAREASTLEFTTDVATAYEDAEVAYVCVGTPPASNGEADLSHLHDSIESIAEHAPDVVVVVKSTVPPGTQRALRGRFPGLKLVSNPEFLQQGSAVAAALHPDRIVFSTEDSDARATMHTLFAPFKANGVPVVDTNPDSAELIKYASNSFLAMKIAFINEIADLCEAIGADIDDVAYGVGLDPRIGDQFLNAGPGFGGSCFPKDTEALVASARSFGVDLSIVDAVTRSNRQRRASLTERVLSSVDHTVKRPHFGVLGLTFKAGTDDLRESPALDVVAGLLRAGATVTVFDPLGDASTVAAISAATVASEAIDVADGADAVVVATEWPEFIDMDFDRMARRMRGSLIVDLRNILDPVTVSNAGLTLRQIGKTSESG